MNVQLGRYEQMCLFVRLKAPASTHVSSVKYMRIYAKSIVYCSLCSIAYVSRHYLDKYKHNLCETHSAFAAMLCELEKKTLPAIVCKHTMLRFRAISSTGFCLYPNVNVLRGARKVSPSLANASECYGSLHRLNRSQLHVLCAIFRPIHHRCNCPKNVVNFSAWEFTRRENTPKFFIDSSRHIY